MDEETKAALELTSEQLRAMRDSGQPGVVAERPRDSNRMATTIVHDSTERLASSTVIRISADDVREVTFSGVLAGNTVELESASMVTVSP